jgi:hypothetical protein
MTHDETSNEETLKKQPMFDRLVPRRLLLWPMQAAQPPSPSKQRARGSATRVGAISTLIFMVALLVRWPRAGQSLWCDEMSTFLDYVIAPWTKIVAARAGEYVPNNHVLFTIADKLVYNFFSTGAAGRSLPSEHLIRLPSILAGALLPIALAWPFRKTLPLFALILAVVAAVHPWLVVFSTEARGYSLLLLLGVLATNCLPEAWSKWPWRYALLIAALLYTVPVGLLLMIGHGIAIYINRRSALLSWLKGVSLGAVLTGLLYLPMIPGLLAYYHHPLPAPNDYVDFVNQLPRFSLTGEYLPRPIDLLDNRPDPLVGWIYWLAPIVIFVTGSAITWKRSESRLVLLAMGLPFAIATTVALIFHSAGQVRFVPWSACWMCICIASIVIWIHTRLGRSAGFLLLVSVCVWMVRLDLTMPPSQPIREALAMVDQVLPPQQPVIAALLTAPQSVALYGPLVTQHPLVVAATIPAFLQAEAQVISATGQRPGLVMSYEYLVRELQPDFWNYISLHYKLVERLPGRLSAVSVYEPAK